MRRRLGSLLGLLLLASTASAPQAADPSETTARYGAWVLRCVTAAEAKTCEILQDVRLENAVRPVMQLAVGFVRSPVAPGADPKLSLVVQLPDTVYLPANAQIAVGEDTGTAQFLRCQSGGCIATLALDDAWITRLSAADAQASATATFYGQGALTIRFSLQGFADAKAAFDARGS